MVILLFDYIYFRVNKINYIIIKIINIIFLVTTNRIIKFV